MGLPLEHSAESGKFLTYKGPLGQPRRPHPQIRKNGHRRLLLTCIRRQEKVQVAQTSFSGVHYTGILRPIHRQVNAKAMKGSSGGGGGLGE